jgi:hypothetical protein
LPLTGKSISNETLTYRARRTLRFEQPSLVGAVTLSPFTLSLNNASSSSQSNDRLEFYRLSFLTLPVRDELLSIFSYGCFQSVAFHKVICLIHPPKVKQHRLLLLIHHQWVVALVSSRRTFCIPPLFRRNREPN